PAEAESARAALIDMGVLPEYTRGDPQTPLGWSELARDLRRARRQGLRLPFSPVTQTSRREDCRRTMGIESAVNPEKPLAKKRGPERSEMCLALADLAGDPPRRAKAADPAAPKRPKIAAMTTAP
ncbi:MAG TPA: hypothetical protein VJY35_11835, partial [Candidatus Eisenbacteria bacterium]|nr:hypothetical protein [Candidatus Eisenbacteria bacterium]